MHQGSENITWAHRLRWTPRSEALLTCSGLSPLKGPGRPATRLEGGEVVVPHPAASSPGRCPQALWPQTSRGPSPQPPSPPHSQILSPSTCEHSFNELGWFSLYLGKEVSEISWFCAEGAWGSVSLQLYKWASTWICIVEVLVVGKGPLWGVGVHHPGDHQVENCFLLTQVLVTTTPSIPSPCV